MKTTKKPNSTLETAKPTNSFFTKSQDTNFFPSISSTPLASPIQTKIASNASYDTLEQQADFMANQVVSQGSLPTTAPTVQTKATENPEEPSQDLEDNINSTKGSGTALPEHTQAEMGGAFGADFSDVKIHTGDTAVQMNQDMGSHAFTHGSDIYFNKQQYSPESNSGKKLLAHELTHTVQQKAVSKRVQPFKVTNAKDVPSLAIASFESKNVAGNWGHLKGKMKQRNNMITARLKTAKSGSDLEKVLKRLDARWPSFKKAISNKKTDPSNMKMPSASAIAGAIKSEKADAKNAALAGRGERFVLGAINEFITAVSNFTDVRAQLDVERKEFKRFDKHINAADAKKLLKAIKGATFNGADLKALTGQETADFTNTNIDGISGSKGIKKAGRKNKTHKGVGQLTSAARDEAISWAAAKGVTIKKSPDPRLKAVTGFLVTAAYMGRMSDLLHKTLPKNIPSGDEFKKLVFAGYNGGHVGVKKAAKAFVGGKAKAYTWSDIKNKTGATAQMRNYVKEIVSRLS